MDKIQYKKELILLKGELELHLSNPQLSEREELQIRFLLKIPKS